VKDHWLLRRAFPCPFSGLTVSLLQETPGFSNGHSIRPKERLGITQMQYILQIIWRTSKDVVKAKFAEFDFHALQ
jgi:hypothetical protein